MQGPLPDDNGVVGSGTVETPTEAKGEKEEKEDITVVCDGEPSEPQLSPHAILGPVYLCVLIDSLGKNKINEPNLQMYN